MLTTDKNYGVYESLQTKVVENNNLQSLVLRGELIKSNFDLL